MRGEGWTRAGDWPQRRRQSPSPSPSPLVPPRKRGEGTVRHRGNAWRQGRTAPTASPFSASARRRRRSSRAGGRSRTSPRASSPTTSRPTRPTPRVRDAKRADYAAAGVEDGGNAPAALAGATLVFSVVTADQAEAAALAALPGLARDAFFFDCNSCAPQTKARSASQVEAAGGRYVDVAVMSPVHPRLHRTPLLISGPHADGGGGGAECARHGAQGSRRAGRLVVGDQDDPLGDDQGARGAGVRMRARRPRGGRRRRRARFARRDLPRLRLEEARRLYDGAGDDARRAPRRGNARSRR